MGRLRRAGWGSTRQDAKRRDPTRRVGAAVAAVLGLMLMPLGPVLPAAAPPAPVPAPCPINSTPPPCSPAFGLPGTAHWDQSMAPASLPSHNGAGEPSLGINWNTDRGMFQAYTSTYRITCTDPPAPATAPATCGWMDVSDPGATVNLDPILITNWQAGRTFAGGLAGGSTYLGYTDDDGATWTPALAPNGADHEGLGSGPWPGGANPNPLGPDYAVYDCAQNTAAPTSCSVSYDGGATYANAVPVTTCPGLHGHPAVAPNGHVFVPSKSCAGGSGYFFSADAGQTWSSNAVPGSMGSGFFDPSIAFSQPSANGLGGVLYYGQAEAFGAWVARSDDEGMGWRQVGDGHLLPAACTRGGGVYFNVGCLASPPIERTMFANVMAGDDQRAAFSFLGARESADPTDCGNALHWHYYVAWTFDGGRTWRLDQASPDWVQVGAIWPGGGGPICRNLLDFADLNMDHTGRVWVGFAKGCVNACTTTGQSYQNAWATVLRQRTGCGLFRQHDQAGTGPFCTTLPVADFSFADWPCAPAAVTFTDASVADPTRTLAASTWDFGDGLPSPDYDGPHVAAIQHTFAEAGAYAVTLAVGDSDGSSSPPVSKTLNVFDCPAPPPPPPPAPPGPPMADPHGPYRGMLGAPVPLYGSGRGGGGAPYSCLWATDEPGVQIVPPGSCTPTVLAGREGAFVLTLTVTDSSDLRPPLSATATTRLTVAAAARDSDMDGVPDYADACAHLADWSQPDADGDGAGDGCDPAPCGDGIPFAMDGARGRAACAQGDARGETGAPATTAALPPVADRDHDGVIDGADLCPDQPDHAQPDLDLDRVGDLCDGDIDGDGIANDRDPCPLDYDAGAGPGACAAVGADALPRPGRAGPATADPAAAPGLLDALPSAGLGIVVASLLAAGAVALARRRWS